MPDAEPDVGEPGARPGSWWLPVALIAVMIIAILVIVAFWGDPEDRAPDPVDPNGAAEATPSIPADGSTGLSATGERLTVKQREQIDLPGSPWRLALDDITGGQVLAEVTDSAGNVIVRRRSLQEGDALLVPTPEAPRLRIEVSRLVNFLTGDDFAELDVAPVATAAPPLTEAEKINALLARIADLEGAMFLRNGSEHTAAEAVDHLRMKWEHAGGTDEPGATAEQFIEGVATKSSFSGRPYRIRLADGTEVESGPWLREQLRHLEAGRMKEP